MDKTENHLGTFLYFVGLMVCAAVFSLSVIFIITADYPPPTERAASDDYSFGLSWTSRDEIKKGCVDGTLAQGSYQCRKEAKQELIELCANGPSKYGLDPDDLREVCHRSGFLTGWW